MVLFHENYCHFNLVVNRESDLATLGSLSYRFNIGPLLDDDHDSNESVQTTENEENME